MTKKQLYIVIGVLVALVLFVFFMPVEAPSELQEGAQQSAVDSLTVEEEQALEASVAKTVDEQEEEQVVLEGIFLSLTDGADEHGKEFKYLLLNDGSEILRVDLRPLIGYSDIDVLQKLGVDRSDRITVTGVMKDGVFSAQEIE
ncbi:MAG: hypothetical protein ACI9H6_000079 [Patiriisocius sp.]|jgi:hypothetical protein